jgi:hypothetical protein
MTDVMIVFFRKRDRSGISHSRNAPCREDVVVREIRRIAMLSNRRSCWLMLDANGRITLVISQEPFQLAMEGSLQRKRARYTIWCSECKR